MEKSNISDSVNSYIPFGINIAIHVVILFLILSVMFIFIISKIEKNALNGQISNNINKIFDNDMLNKIKHNTVVQENIINDNMLNKLKAKYSKVDDKVQLTNNWIIRAIIGTNIALLILVSGFIITSMFQCNQNVNLGETLKMNIITFIGVGIIEYLFFTQVALKYIPIKPSVMVDSFFASVDKNLSS